MGIVAIILTITVASKIIGTEQILGIEASSWVAWGAAISTGLLASLNIGGKANNIWNGWRILNEAKMRYMNQDEFKIDKLIDAYRDAEKTIGGVDIKVSL